MKWFFIFKFLPIPVFYTYNFLKPYQAGRSLGILAIIRPDEYELTGLHEHELEHCKQFYIFMLASIVAAFIFKFLYGIEIITTWLYVLSPCTYFALRICIPLFRYDMEIAAYHVQLAHFDTVYRNSKRKQFAQAIATEYNLNSNKYTMSRAMKDLL